MQADARTSPFRRALIVANPIAGSGRARPAAETLRAELARLSIAPELFFTGARGDARAEVARRAGNYDVVVAVGGDGTAGEVLSGLVDPSIPVAILPLGTANVMSLDLGLSREPANCARMLAAGRTQAIDVARVDRGDARVDGGRLSFLVTGAGHDASIVRQLEVLRRGPITKRTWVRAGANALLRAPPPHLSVTLDDRELPGEFCQVLFSNIVHYGGFRILAGDRRLDDGEWELYLFPATSILGVLGYGARALLRGFPSGRVQRLRGRKLEVRSATPAPFQVDGDLGGTTPFTIEVERVQRHLVVP